MVSPIKKMVIGNQEIWDLDIEQARDLRSEIINFQLDWLAGMDQEERSLPSYRSIGNL
jgi:hypothetical protein